MAKELKRASDRLVGATKAPASEAPKETKAPAPKAAPTPAPFVVEFKDDPEFKTERTQILLRKSTKAALKKLARVQTHGSLNELINCICEAYVKAQEEQK